jgi:hypothetical protein
MGCCPSKRDNAVPPVQLEPQLELEALLAEAVRAGLLDRRSAAESRRRIDTGEVHITETITTWREILGLDAADHAAADARERAWRAGGARSLRNRVRSRSLVASAHDDISSEDTASVESREDSSSDSDEEDTIGRTRDVRRLSFLRRLTKGSARFDNTESGWVDCKVVACGQFGLGVLQDDGVTPLQNSPRLQAGDVVPGLVDDCQGDLLRIRLPDGREGLAPRQRMEDDRVRVLIAPRASVPDRPERSSADLSQKLATLREACASLAIPWSRGHVDVKCRRSEVAETALTIASSRPARDFRKTWRFELTGERGMDAGGVARECWAHVADGVEIKVLRRVRPESSRQPPHAIDAMSARWCGGVDSSPLDGASTAASSPRNDSAKNYRVHATLVDFRTGRRGSVLR